jgi:LysM repeat protein
MLMLFLFLTGCQEPNNLAQNELDHRDYKSAKQKLREGDYEAALERFLRVTESLSFSPESHLEAGVIYLRQEGDPVTAIYHFNQYLLQKPGSREAQLVEGLILSARKEFAASLPGNPLKNSVERMELLETIATLKRDLEQSYAQVESLKLEVERLNGQLMGTREVFKEILTTNTIEPEDDAQVIAAPIEIEASRTASESAVLAQEMDASIPETHRVVPGDSLYGISMQYYGDADHIQSIFQLNRDILRSANDLKPGQVLRLPR